MKRREFATWAALGATLATSSRAGAEPARPPQGGPALLTLSGAIGKPNRGPFDAAFDQLLGKHQVRFERAHAFDHATLAALPHLTLRPTLEYDEKPHALSGPLLTQVVSAAGGETADDTRLLLRALDGYAVELRVAEARRYRFIVATHLDGQPMALGGLGPLWAAYDADRFPDMAERPLSERFARCPWGLYHIEVLPAA